MTVVVPIQRSKAAADARAERVGVLLVNLGTPDRADARGVRVYLQYSAGTSATVCDEVSRVLGDMRAQPTLRVTPPYYDDPDYIEALAVSINTHLANLPFQPEIIVASFHGMPQKYVDKGDPYRAQCIATTDALRKRMGLDASKLKLTFQSRFGFDAWLQPYTDKTMEQLAKDGVRRIAVVTPGFSADCLETLEEIAQENAEIFKHNGGQHFAAIPCLNDSDPGMDVIRQLVLRQLQGWICRLINAIHINPAQMPYTS